jgi:uncharacterized protein YkwD
VGRLTASSLLGIGLLGGAMTWSVDASHDAWAAGAHAAHSMKMEPNAQSWSTSLLRIINRDRTRYGLPRLHLTSAQSLGNASCVGSYGHAEAMARSGAIWHVSARFRRASFPNSICVHFLHVGENVGESSEGNPMRDLRTLDTLMMAEPHSTTVCATTVNHACNILNPMFHQVGIGVYSSNGTTWLTEDFTD